MHSLHEGNYNALFNGDLSGTVIFNDGEGGNEVRVPSSLVLAVVAYVVRVERISELEDMSDEALLGLPERGRK